MRVKKNSNFYNKNKSYIGFYLSNKMKKDLDDILKKKGIKKTEFFIYCIRKIKEENKDNLIILNWDNF